MAGSRMSTMLRKSLTHYRQRISSTRELQSRCNKTSMQTIALEMDVIHSWSIPWRNLPTFSLSFSIFWITCLTSTHKAHCDAVATEINTMHPLALPWKQHP